MAKFGFNRRAIAGNRNVGISADDMYVTRYDHEKVSDHGVVCGAMPFRGASIFEVELTIYKDRRTKKRKWGWSVAVGILRHTVDYKLDRFSVPQSFEFGSGRIVVWTRHEVMNKLGWSRQKQFKYGKMHLNDLKTGDRIGIQVERNGNLFFTVNGESQGLAANNVYLEGYDVYPVVDMTGDCIAARIIRADSELQIGRQASAFRVPKISDSEEPVVDPLQFGFNPITGSKVALAENNQIARRIDPDKNTDNAVVYGAKPIGLMGWFEVEILECDDNSYTDSAELYHTLGMGVIRRPSGHVLEKSNIPSRAYLGENHCVWWGNSVWNRFLNFSTSESNTHTPMDLNDLRIGDKVGMRIARNGSLMFYVNNKCQGFMTPTEDLYDMNYDFYPLVDIGGSFSAVKVVRAEVGAKYLNLQELCIEQIVCSLRSPKFIWRLRKLPEHLRRRIKLYYVEELQTLANEEDRKSDEDFL